MIKINNNIGDGIDCSILYKKSPRKPTAFRRGMNWEN